MWYVCCYTFSSRYACSWNCILVLKWDQRNRKNTFSRCSLVTVCTWCWLGDSLNFADITYFPTQWKGLGWHLFISFFFFLFLQDEKFPFFPPFFWNLMNVSRYTNVPMYTSRFVFLLNGYLLLQRHENVVISRKWSAEGYLWPSESTSVLCRRLSTDRDCPKRLWSLLLGDLQNPCLGMNLLWVSLLREGVAPSEGLANLSRYWCTHLLHSEWWSIGVVVTHL